MLHKVLQTIEDDTEEAPWMTMGTPQWDALKQFAPGLDAEMRTRQPPLFAAAMLPIRYRLTPQAHVEQLAPDVLVDRVPIRPRSSYSVEREGKPPEFVLEVVSPESQTRDLATKRERYAAIGISEYAIFAPETAEGLRLLEPSLQGFRLDPASSEYVSWKPDAEGRLYSEVLALWLVERDGTLRAQRPDGSWVSTLEEAERARAAAEAEVARLRAELEARNTTRD